MKAAAGNRPVAARPPISQTPMSFRRMIALARKTISGVVLSFLLVTGIGVLASIVGQYNAQLIASFIAQATSSGASVAPSKAGFDLLSGILPTDPAWTAILFALTGLLTIGLGFTNRVGTVWLNTRMLRRLQQQLHDKLLQLGPNFHSRYDLGENTAVLTQYAAQAAPMLRDLIAFPLVRGVSLTVAVIFLFHNLSALEGQGPVLYALLGAMILLLPVGGVWLAGRMRSTSLAVQDQYARFSNVLVDSLTAPQELRLMDATERRSHVFAASLSELGRAQVRAAIQSEFATQFQAAVPLLLQIGLILWAVFFVPGEAVQAVVGIYLFVPRVVEPIQEIVRFYGTVNIAWPSIERIGQVLDEPVETRDEGKLGADALRNGEVALEGVVYRPTPDKTIVDGLSCRFAEGKVTALVGLSGSGKSTVLRLIARMFDPTEGRVTIGGIDIRDLGIAALRSQVGVVSQFPLFIAADVRENMRLVAPQATDEQMEAACRQADIWSSLEKVSPGDPLSAHVPRTAGSAGLSGGERRRLAIARALLAQPRILLLDEPGAGIDALSVARIAEEIRTIAQTRTVILVEHSIHLVQATADMVCCLAEGRITDQGTPSELAARPSLYRQMLEAQGQVADESRYDIQNSLPVRRIDAPLGRSPASAERSPTVRAAKAAMATDREAGSGHDHGRHI